ncbi:uncharacterized protein ATNIH1004_009330 [Aspergillus tanneri]|uniref:Uncharacterized protein n=1 Tax=Aspergillus tanneri TaxID=1220188 RepID=A0A5M9MJH1_9EURO|nr:uncharacterized protein ATNIH1004_009330 [Aspergillus tanneri]KAA8645113.1 hypothetical protein ATNIH1004_009330 [Aspergillus tanneri]
MAFYLCVEAFGNGEDPNHRCHWGFLLHHSQEDFGDLYEVQLIDLKKLWYQANCREATTIRDPQAVGMCKIAVLDAKSRYAAIRVIKDEPAPRDGKRRCQDWTVDVLISLEAEELVASGTAERWGRLVGMTAKELAVDSGDNWTAF